LTSADQFAPNHAPQCGHRSASAATSPLQLEQTTVEATLGQSILR
jgi:hypothetical protein